MKSLDKDSDGFGVIGLLIVIAAVAVIGSLGWYVVAHKKVNSQNDSTTTQQTTSTQPKTVQTTTSQAQQAAPAPLVISEWGVKMPLTSTISDAYYVVSKSSQDTNGQPNTMLLGLKSLDSNGCNAAGPNTGKDTAIGAVLRVLPTDKDPVTGKLYTQEYPNGSTVGAYYYGVQDLTQHLTCASQAQLQSAITSFEAAAKSTVSNTAQ